MASEFSIHDAEDWYNVSPTDWSKRFEDIYTLPLFKMHEFLEVRCENDSHRMLSCVIRRKTGSMGASIQHLREHGTMPARRENTCFISVKDYTSQMIRIGTGFLVNNYMNLAPEVFCEGKLKVKFTAYGSASVGFIMP